MSDTARPARWIRWTLLTTLALALTAVGAVGGALWQREEPKAFSATHESICGVQLLAFPTKELDPVVPPAPGMNTSNEVVSKPGRYQAHCAVHNEESAPFKLSVEQRPYDVPSDDRAYRQEQRKREKIPGYPKSWSTTDTAMVTVPCTEKKGSKEDTDLYVRAESRSKHSEEVRGALVKAAEEAAKNTRAAVKCDTPFTPQGRG